MSDPVVQTYNDCARKTERSMQASHSVWMARWTRRDFDAALQNHSCSSSLYGKKEIDHDTKEYQSMSKIEIASNISNPAKGLRKFGTGTLEVANESLRMTSTTIRNENIGFQSFRTNTPGQNDGSSSALKEKRAACDIEVMRPRLNLNLVDDISTSPMQRSSIPLLPMAPDANSTPSRECHSDTEGPLQNAKEPVKTLTVFGDSGFAMSRPWPEDFTASASQIVQCGFGNKNNRISFLPSFMGSTASAFKEELRHTNLRFFEREKFDYKRHSAFSLCDEKLERHLECERSTTSFLKKNKMPLLQTDPLTRDNHSPAIGGEHLQKIHNFSGIGLLQNQLKLSEATKSEKLHHRCNSHPKVPHTLHDMETVRSCTTVDSVLGVRGGHPRFSQTTHSLLITKSTDFNLFNRNKNFSNYRGFAEFNGNALSDLHTLSPPLWQAQQGVQLQSLSSFTGSEEKENADDLNPLRVNAKGKNVEDVKVFDYSVDGKGKNVEHVSDSDLKNESSADTDTMDLNDFEEKNSGVNSSSSKKIIKLGSVTPEFSFGSASEAAHGQRKTELPDINLELPALPDPAEMLDNGEPSTSRTESLDMGTVLAHAEHLGNSQSDRYFGGSAEPESSRRWVKRLKLSSSDSLALGTKSSNLGEEIPHENSLVSRRIHTASLEPIVNGHHGKELMVLDKTTAPMGCSESSSMERANKGIDLLFSHSWIRRWRHSQAATLRKKPEAVVVCEPQSSKLALEDLKEKQFPSIAAMALMGKAMSGFQRCEFQKRGSFVVWNTRGS